MLVGLALKQTETGPQLKKETEELGHVIVMKAQAHTMEQTLLRTLEQSKQGQQMNSCLMKTKAGIQNGQTYSFQMTRQSTCMLLVMV